MTMTDEKIERIWNETEKYILKNNGEGGYIIEENPTTYGEFPVGFNDIRNQENKVYVNTDAEVNVAEMFWCPHVHEKTRNLFREWVKKNRFTDEEVREKISYYVIQFRNEHKDILFGIARRILHEDLPKPVKHTVITVKVKPAVKQKPVHKNTAIVGTGITTGIISVVSYVNHFLPPDIGNMIIGTVAVILAFIEHTSVKKIMEEIE